MRFGKPEKPLNWHTNAIHMVAADREVSWIDGQRDLDEEERQRKLLKEYGKPAIRDHDDPPIF